MYCITALKCTVHVVVEEGAAGSGANYSCEEREGRALKITRHLQNM